MKRTSKIRTTLVLAFVDDQCLHGDATQMARKLMGNNMTHKLIISSEPIEGYTKAGQIGKIGNTTQYKTKIGVFTVCDKYVESYALGKQFYFKILK